MRKLVEIILLMAVSDDIIAWTGLWWGWEGVAAGLDDVEFVEVKTSWNEVLRQPRCWKNRLSPRAGTNAQSKG